MLETHPHLHLFDASRNWKYLIIGTFPPNSAVRERAYIDYFYGNKGFLWKIIHDIYHDRGYDFFRGTMKENVAEIVRWQNDYCVGLSDTIRKCRRKYPTSSQDTDLTDIELNHDLKKYILDRTGDIRKIIFTSSSGKNSAFQNFKKIMGEDIALVKDVLVTGLPSPSGASNITFFNTNTEETLGLTRDFYQYVVNEQPQFIGHFEIRWKMKKRKLAARGDKKQEILIPAAPKGLVHQYKLWKYRQSLPADKC